jgi:hypothetical protein
VVYYFSGVLSDALWCTYERHHPQFIRGEENELIFSDIVHFIEAAASGKSALSLRGPRPQTTTRNIRVTQENVTHRFRRQIEAFRTVAKETQPK